jgi:hypothetical protein
MVSETKYKNLESLKLKVCSSAIKEFSQVKKMQKYNCDSQKLQAAAGLLLRGEDNLSRHYRKTNRAIKGASLQPLPITPEGNTESSTQQRTHTTTPAA